MSEWQPIDTPPEDEGAVQVYIPDIQCTFMAYYCDGEFTASWNPTPEMMNRISRWKKPDAPTNLPEISSTSALRALVKTCRDVAEDVGLTGNNEDGNRIATIADELEALIERLTSSIPDTTALKGQ